MWTLVDAQHTVARRQSFYVNCQSAPALTEVNPQPTTCMHYENLRIKSATYEEMHALYVIPYAGEKGRLVKRMFDVGLSWRREYAASPWLSRYVPSSV